MNNIKMQYICHEPFWKFKKNDDTTRHCSVCKKNVVDFRNFSNQEIEAFRLKNTDTTCGIFTEDQVIIDENTQFGNSTFKIIVASVVSFFTFSFSDAYAQNTVSVKTEQHPFTKTDSSSNNKKANKSIDNQKKEEVKSEETNSKQKSRYSRKYLIGGLYIDNRFPFFHIQRRLRGVPTYY
jgi:hypothetical protein